MIATGVLVAPVTVAGEPTAAASMIEAPGPGIELATSRSIATPGVGNTRSMQADIGSGGFVGAGILRS